jgi:dihydroneopterin aldolase
MTHPAYASAALGTRHVFVRDLVISASIGVYQSEHEALQRIRINLDLAVAEDGDPRDALSRVVDYEAVANQARTIIASGHVKLVETLAERIADAILTDTRILRVCVQVEKLDVFADVGSVGVQIERFRN